jgi:hypothetical protein
MRRTCTSISNCRRWTQRRHASILCLNSPSTRVRAHQPAHSSRCGPMHLMVSPSHSARCCSRCVLRRDDGSREWRAGTARGGATDPSGPTSVARERATLSRRLTCAGNNKAESTHRHTTQCAMVQTRCDQPLASLDEWCTCMHANRLFANSSITTDVLLFLSSLTLRTAHTNVLCRLASFSRPSVLLSCRICRSSACDGGVHSRRRCRSAIDRHRRVEIDHSLVVSVCQSTAGEEGRHTLGDGSRLFRAARRLRTTDRKFLCRVVT